MSSKNISTFLPKHLRNDDVRGFINGTTQTLFDEDTSEYISEYVGRKVGGIFEHKRDAYTQEISKIRQDYQLEPALVTKNDDNSTDKIVFFDDVVNTLRNGNISNSDFERMFGCESYTYSPPINYDMFANFGNYYWIPEGVPAIEIVAIPEHIIGLKNFAGLVSGTTDTYQLMEGNHIILEDGKEYIVTGVGEYIELIEFDLDNNKPNRVSLRSGASDDSLITLFPKEYITIERGSVENSPWTRNNSWYHVSVVYPNVPTVNELDISIAERRALRPIIQYRKNMELFEYISGVGIDVDVRLTSEELPERIDSIIDGIDTFEGMRVIVNGNPNIFRSVIGKITNEEENGEEENGEEENGEEEILGYIWEEIEIDNTEKIIINDGLAHRGEEVIWRDDEWFVLQRKSGDTQEILFDVFTKDDSGNSISISEINGSGFEGSSIFGYRTGGGSLTYDRELGMSVAIHTNQASSEFVFESSISDYFLRNRKFVEDNTNGLYFKVNSSILPASKRILRLSIGTDNNGDYAILINGEHHDVFTMYANQVYTFDASDSTNSTVNTWGGSTSIVVVDEYDNIVVPAMIRGSSRESFETSISSTGTYYCRSEINGQIVNSTIEVMDYNDDHYFITDYTKLSNNLNKIHEHVNVHDKKSFSDIKLQYLPTSDKDIKVLVSGANVPFSHNSKKIEIPSIYIMDGSFIEVIYTTNERIKPDNPSHVKQALPRCISHNPVNGLLNTFRYDEIFTHLTDVIENQYNFQGTSQGNNNYQNLSTDLSTGGNIIRNSVSPIPMMFSLSHEKMNVQRSIETSRKFYQSFKNQLILETENLISNISASVIRPHTIFDSVVRVINANKLPSTSAFANTGMFAYGDNFIDVRITQEGTIKTKFEKNQSNILYIADNNGKTLLLDKDYTLTMNNEGYHVINPLTFSISNIIIARLYIDMLPSYCPATPQKLGLLPSHVPEMYIDETFENPVLFILGHDGSKTRAYTTLSNFNENNIDIRDMVLLEFETRVYNGINQKFRKMDRPLLNPSVTNKRIGYTGLFDEEEKDSIVTELFFKWCNDGSIDYHENTTYTPENPWTYNYSKSSSFDGMPLKGHWRGIYEDYFGTSTPHKTPWEMIGFTVKPLWWHDEYGNNFGSTNEKMWDDIFEGIIRRGDYKNDNDLEYVNNNPYRRIDLKDKLPVSHDGSLLDPIECGIVVDIREVTLSEQWSIDDNSPAEQTWRRSSDYQFDKILCWYALRPFETCSLGWDTIRTHHGRIWEIDQTSTHNDTNTLLGIGVWIADNLKNESIDITDNFDNKFDSIDMNLSYKVGGFINSKEVRMMSENANSSPIAPEDFEVIIHRGEEITNMSYSGVIVERVEAVSHKRPFVSGLPYRKDDIVYISEDRSYYRKILTNNINDWEENTFYNVSNEVEYMGMYYTCIESHMSNESVNPSDRSKWKLRDFLPHEWVILIKPPVSNRTAFKVYGYDISKPYFEVYPSIRSNNPNKITAYGKGAVPVNVEDWVRFTEYREGTIVKHSDYIYECISRHTSGANFDSNFWKQLQDVPLTNRIDVEYFNNGTDNAKKIEYHTTLDTIEEVVELLISYGRFLTRHEGFIFDEYDREKKMNIDWVYSAHEFVEWAINNQRKGSVISLSPAKNHLKLKDKHGIISITQNKNSSIYDLLTYNGRPISKESIKVNRDRGYYNLYSDEPVFYAKLGVHEYEHAIRLNNQTLFNDVIFNKVNGSRIGRIFIRGSKTGVWDGRLYAPGYIITNEGIRPNFDTAVKDITRFNDMSVMSPRSVINDLKFHNIGYQRRKYLENLGLDGKSQVDFYSGFIREKGTLSSYKKISRSNAVSGQDTLDVIEEWAFKESIFGGAANYSQIEIKLRADEFVFNPQYIRLVYNDQEPSDVHGEINIDKENYEEWLTKPSRITGSGEIFTTINPEFTYKDAGYVLYDEHELKASNFTTLRKRMKELMIPYEIGMTAWLSNDRMNGDTWGVFLLDNTNAVISSVLDGGTEGVNGALIRASNIHPEMPYSIIDENDERRNVLFYHIREDIYLTLDDDENEYVILSEDAEPSDLGLLQWKPLRISSNPITRFIDNVHSHTVRYRITPFEGLLLYKDEEMHGMGNYSVYRYNGDSWESIRGNELTIDSSLVKEVAMYDEDDKLIEYLNVYDPLQGLIPGARTDLIDYISTEDPITYERRGDRDYSEVKNMVGQLWWDIGDYILYNYHIGDTDYKKNVWGTLFPDSEVSVYEWVRSLEKPEDYDGEVKSFNEYIEFSEYNYALNEYTTYYYFWVKNPLDVPNGVNRNMSANNIAVSIRNPSNNGFAMLSIFDNYNIVVMDEAQTMMVNECKLKIYYQLNETTSLPHTNWIILPEDYRYSNIPEFLFERLLDSIVGYDKTGNVVPREGLSPSDRYGNDIGQTWFIDRKGAVEIFNDLLGKHLARINIGELGINEDSTFMEDASQIVEIGNWYSSNYNHGRLISKVVRDITHIADANPVDGEYIRVITSEDSLEEWEIYEWDEESGDINLIGKSNSVLILKENAFLGNYSDEELFTIRNALGTLLGSSITTREYQDILNVIFFSMIRYVYTEQPNNNWVFPTTYVTILEDNAPLEQIETFQDNPSGDISDYLREVKPFHTKIRNYDRIYTIDSDTADMSLRVTDFDNPVFFSQNQNMGVLQNKLIETFIPDGRDYPLTYDHTSEIIVMDDGVYVEPQNYSIEERVLKLNYTPSEGRNHVRSIVIDSRNVEAQEKIDQWIRSWGYGRYLKDTFDFDLWSNISSRKDVVSVYNDVSLSSQNSFEHLSSLIDNRSHYTAVGDTEKYSEKDRFMIHRDTESFQRIVQKSFSFTNEGEVPVYDIEYDGGKVGFVALINGNPIHDSAWWLSGEFLHSEIPLYKGDTLNVRPHRQYIDYLFDLEISSNKLRDNGVLTPSFLDDNFSSSVLINKLDVVSVNQIQEYNFLTTLNIEFDPEYQFYEAKEEIVEDNEEDKDAVILNQGMFNDVSNGQGTELVSLKVHESINITYVNRRPVLEKIEEHDKMESRKFQHPIEITTINGVREYDLDLNTDWYYTVVYMNDNVMINGVMYTITDNKLLLNNNPGEGNIIKVLDVNSSSLSSQHTNKPVLTKRAGGGYIANFDTGNICDDEMVVREFVLYDRRGNRDHYKCRLYDYFRIKEIDEETGKIKLMENDADGITFTNKIFAIVRTSSINLEGSNPIDYEISTGSMKDSMLTLYKRGLYGTDKFTDQELENDKIFIYMLNYHQETSEFILFDAKNGELDNYNYPKLGNIIFRSS